MAGFRLCRAHGSVEAAVSAAKPSTRHACHYRDTRRKTGMLPVRLAGFYPLSLMQQRESLLGAQTGKSVFRLIHLLKINLEPAMTRTVASKIETVRTGNWRLPKYEPIEIGRASCR